jgi:hypothetical protein
VTVQAEWVEDKRSAGMRSDAQACPPSFANCPPIQQLALWSRVLKRVSLVSLARSGQHWPQRYRRSVNRPQDRHNCGGNTGLLYRYCPCFMGLCRADSPLSGELGGFSGLDKDIVRETVHLIERTHNARFRELMDRFLPDGQSCREELNRTPLGHASWTY